MCYTNKHVRWRVIEPNTDQYKKTMLGIFHTNFEYSTQANRRWWLDWVYKCGFQRFKDMDLGEQARILVSQTTNHTFEPSISLISLFSLVVDNLAQLLVFDFLSNWENSLSTTNLQMIGRDLLSTNFITFNYHWPS